MEISLHRIMSQQNADFQRRHMTTNTQIVNRLRITNLYIATLLLQELASTVCVTESQTWTLCLCVLCLLYLSDYNVSFFLLSQHLYFPIVPFDVPQVS